MLTRTLASSHLLTQANNLFYIKKYYTYYKQNDEEDEDFPVVNLLKQIEWQWHNILAAKLIVMNHCTTLMNFGEVLGDFDEQSRDYYSSGFVQNLNMASITQPPQLASALF